ncbi:MAG: enoyl-CoA hydratase/isomerase family protein [Firmicutes bacterium]|nr:enoyl-CoA hydratase/isomerase family protein [Alicyclobacillaceae bacterium]MCL6498227.1 enoyl-CoA hydratase/isomerase family protein [Bacillota bacterium]
MGQVTAVVEAGGWARIRIDNQPYRNCLGRAMWNQLRECAQALARDGQVRAVVVEGVGRDFTTGYDLSELAGQPVSMVNRAFQEMEAAIAAVESLPVPVIAAVRGYCLGGGFELALAADLRWVGDDARLGMPVARLGIMLSRRFAWRLVQALGPSAAKELLFTGRLLDAHEALQRGVANRVVPAGEVALAAGEVATAIARLSPSAVQQAKRSVGEVVGPATDDAPYFVDAADFAAAVERFRR